MTCEHQSEDLRHPRPWDKGLIYEEIYTFESLQKDHNREIYSLMDCLGDVGGVLGILQIIFSVAIQPYSELIFYLNAIQKMFSANSTETLFKTQIFKNDKS